MPIREFECMSCNARFEAMQRISDSSIPTCPECNSDHVERRVSQTSFILKGSGWYATDYARKGSSSAVSPASNGKDHSAAGGKDHSEAGGKDHSEAGGKDHSEAGGKDHSEAGGKDHSESGGKDHTGSKSEETKPAKESKSKPKAASA